MTSPFEAALVDMGGVLLEMGGHRGLPGGRLDFRGREAMLHHFHDRGVHFELRDLERRLFAPWRAEHEQRAARGREASWAPHLRRLRRGTGVRTPDRTLLATWFRPYGDQVEAIAGAATALDELEQRGVRLALVSNVPLPGALYRTVLERHGLARHFRTFRFSYDRGSRKPSPAMLRSALRALRVAPGRALMVGDRRSRDVAAGRTAGVTTVWVRSEDGGGPPPEHEIVALAELPGLLDRLSRGASG